MLRVPETRFVVLLAVLSACSQSSGGGSGGEAGNNVQMTTDGGNGGKSSAGTGGTPTAGASGAGTGGASGTGALGGIHDAAPSPAGGSGPDAGSIAADTAMPDVRPEGTVPVFVAVGRGGRRLVSCDDGRTWIGACSTDGTADADCTVEDNQDDHSAWVSTGLAYGDGVFLALYGWFGVLPSAQILRTDDGVAWTNVFGGPGRPQGTFGTDIAFGNGVFAVNAQRSATHRSTDRGTTWTTKEFINGDRPHRRSMVFIPFGRGRFISYGDEGRATYSDDDGVTWKETTQDCPYLRGFAWGNGALVVNAHEGSCRSTDGGLHWTIVKMWFGENNPVWTGSEFYVAMPAENVSFRSPDGVAWKPAKMTGATNNIGPQMIAIGPKGTFVGVNSNGDAFFRSTDRGASWTRATGPSGNGLTNIAFGYVKPSPACPAN